MNKIKSLSALLLLSPLALVFFFSRAHALEPHNTIQGLFNTPRDVVIKCLECHRQIAGEVLQSTHWTWKRPLVVNEKQFMHGKKDSLAGFAIDIASNPARCLQCHISTAPDAAIFTNGEEADVDCLVCHDTTGRYAGGGRKGELSQGDFETIARNVGRPAPENCMICHFADCGLPASSHREVDGHGERHLPASDVHMGGKTGAFTCQGCHQKSSGHSFSRSMSPGSSSDAAVDGCSSCHTGAPHSLDTLNNHVAKVSCRTCHIPTYANDLPAVVSWNWLMTGKIDPVYQALAGRESYLQDKNGFTTSRTIRPVYLWDDGSDTFYSRGQRIQPQELTFLQRPGGKNENSKISPFMVLYGTQLYDTKYRYLISPLLSAEGSELFPGSDWDVIAREGMKAIILPYSGQYGFAPTAAFRRLNHGVAPAGDALDCTDCHGSSSLLNWQKLGYDRDPWSGVQAARQQKQEPLQGEQVSGKLVRPLIPIQEIPIYSAPSL